MIGFVSKGLMAESGDHMVEMEKNSPSMSTVFNYGNRFLKGVNAEDLIAKGINYYV